MKKLKVLTVVGTRPEIIRLSSIIKKFENIFDHKLVHTGQNYDFELNEIFFKDLQLNQPDYYLDAADKSGTKTIGNVIRLIDDVLEKENPDAVMILGDTNSCLSVIAAKNRKIPTFHFEAGNRCFDMRVPEEINRKIVDHTADVNLTYSSIAREYLLREGLQPDLVIKVGSPMKEVLNDNSKKIEQSKILTQLKLKTNNYFVVSAHRQENIESEINFNKILSIISEVESHFELPIIVSTHPRTRKKLESSSNNFSKNVNFLKPLSFSDYIRLQKESKLVLSDSGTINEEASILQFNAINLRESYERPESAEEGTTILTGLSLDRVFQGINLFENINKSKVKSIVKDYDVDNVSEKVANIILSYTDYINRVVWKKY
jgi:UDP-N-acetylglucosamine 2-epimerase